VPLIELTITPQSWDDIGGPGTLQGFDGGCAVVVSADSETADDSL
jgi:hypothetical protein